MEFLQKTYLETTTQLTVNSSTVTSENIMNPDIAYQHVSDGLNSDLTTSTITIAFDATTSIDRIAIMGFNAKKFNVYYNRLTASAFTLTNPTTTSQWTTNSATSLYLAATAVNCTSVTFDFYSTQVANSEKAVGYIYVGANELTFARVPNASGYKPTRDAKEFLHELSDGGTRRHVIQTKWKTKLKFSNITESFKNSLEDIYDQAEPKVFVPFGTGTSWDGILYECIWAGDFDFHTYSDEATQSGFSGSLDLRES